MGWCMENATIIVSLSPSQPAFERGLKTDFSPFLKGTVFTHCVLICFLMLQSFHCNNSLVTCTKGTCKKQNILLKTQNWSLMQSDLHNSFITVFCCLSWPLPSLLTPAISSRLATVASSVLLHYHCYRCSNTSLDCCVRARATLYYITHALNCYYLVILL